MADVATPAAVAAAGFSVVLASNWMGLSSMGIDPASMGAALGGVVIAQTLLPPTVQGIKGIIGLGIGSMLLASYMAPIVTPFVIGNASRMAAAFDWQWLTQVPQEHLKAMSAAAIGAFAQPIFVWVRSLLPKRAADSSAGKVEP